MFNVCEAMDRVKQQTFITTTKFSNAPDTMFKYNKMPVREHPPLYESKCTQATDSMHP